MSSSPSRTRSDSAGHSGSRAALSAPGTLVTTEWLAAHLGHPRLRVVDGTWHMPHLGRDARAEFAAGHVPGAAFFDVDAIADLDVALPHMLPPADQFARQVGALGIGTGDLVVAYDTRGVVSAARVWWTFRAMGHDRVAVLDGGLAKWRAEGRPLEAGGVDLDQPVTTTCGSGVTASVLALGLHLLGSGAVAVYDGSWSEWGGRDDTPIER